MQNALAEKLALLTDDMSPAERANYKLILGLAASGLAQEAGVVLDQRRYSALGAVSRSLVELQPYKARITSDGIAWKGKPSFVTPDLLRELQQEAVAIRGAAVDLRNHSLGCGAPIANRVAMSDELTSLVRDFAGDVSPTGIASFIFYDEKGQGISPHVDTDIFSLNVILMLKQEVVDQPPSRLVVYPIDDVPKPVLIEEGEMVIMFAGSIVHGREPLSDGEKVTLLTFGFHPLGI